MSFDTAIRISGLSKLYSIQAAEGYRPTSLAEAITAKLRRPFRRAKTSEFWALKDINLEINQSDVVGIIGRNGAGKSTLLKVLSRITEPTTGKIELFGRVGSLLEVGTGFHPELTGRENIYLNGSILGMRRPEIKSQFDEIVEFAGIKRFLDTPVKRYSSGMYVRLAFAVAAHLNPEILIVDEVLAVGDAEFQEKCLGKMKDVASRGRTVLFVSHNLSAIRMLCNKGLLLRDGRVEFSGDINDCINNYSSEKIHLGAASPRPNAGNDRRQILQVTPESPVLNARSPVRFSITLNSSEQPVWCHLSLHIYNSVRQNVATISTEHLDSGYLKPDVVAVELELLSPYLLPGIYEIDAFLYAGGIIDSWQSAASFEVSESISQSGYSASSNVGCRFCFSEFKLDTYSKNDY